MVLDLLVVFVLRGWQDQGGVLECGAPTTHSCLSSLIDSLEHLYYIYSEGTSPNIGGNWGEVSPRVPFLIYLCHTLSGDQDALTRLGKQRNSAQPPVVSIYRACNLSEHPISLLTGYRQVLYLCIFIYISLLTGYS